MQYGRLIGNGCGAALACCLIAACAEIVAPPGGEPDKSAPTILLSNPANGATSVPAGRTISIQFSEQIVRPTDNRSVFISPRPELPPQFRWHADRLDITLAEEFLPNQTYAILFQSGIADLRGNQIDTGSVVAFSTGVRIEEGRVSGVVTRNGKPEQSVTVSLYLAADSAEIGRIPPRFQLGTNRLGQFVFRYLPAASYLLIAFIDQNRNELLETATEEYGLADRTLDLGAQQNVHGISCELARADTAAATIRTGAATSDGLLQVVLSTRVHPSDLSDTTISLVALRDSSRIELIGPCVFADTLTHILLCDFGPLDSGQYRLELRPPLVPIRLTKDSLAIRQSTDKSRPKLVGVSPEGRDQFADSLREIRLRFSEAVEQGDSILPFRWQRSNGSADSIIVRRTGACEWTVVPQAIAPATRYQLFINGMQLSDRSGNRLTDSLRSIEFRTFDPDSLGTISGTLQRPAGAGQVPIILFAKRVADQRQFTLRAPDNSFSQRVPPGKYLLSGYIDFNQNSRYDRGSLSPWRLAERKLQWPDTIVVRARFETSDVQLSTDEAN